MAEAAQRAGIEINLQIAGIDELESVHNKVNSLISDLPKLKESMNGLHMNIDFGEKADNQINTLNTNLGKTNQILKDVHSDVQSIANPLRSDSEQAENLTSKFKTTKDTVNDLTSNIKNVGNDTKQVGENAKQIDEPFKQAVNILSEISVDIKKVVDFQHQQTTAVKETNTSLRDVASLSEKIYTGQGRQTDAIRTTNVQIGQTRMAIGEISRAQEGVTSDIKETESATSGWKDKLSGLKEKLDITPVFEKNSTATNDFNGKIDKTKNSVNEVEKSSKRLRDTFLGTFAGNVISNGFNSIYMGFKEIIKFGQEYNVEQDTMRTVWKALTTEVPNDGKHLVKFINDMASNSIYASKTLDEMAQSFYHVHSNEKEAKKWSEDFVKLGSTMHMSNDALAEAGTQFAKIVAGGKANSEDMQVMINRFPMFGEALQKVTGKSMADLYKLSAQGKLTGKMFEQALDSLGKKYKDGQTEAMTSFQGMHMYLTQRISTLAGEVEKSSFKMTKSASSSMKELLSDKMMKQYANGISAALGKVTEFFVNILVYVNKNKKPLLDIFGSILNIIGLIASGAWEAFKGVLTGISNAFSLITGNSKKAKDPIHSVAGALKEVAKHKDTMKAVGGILATMFAAKKVLEFVLAVKKVNDNLKITTGIVKTMDFLFVDSSLGIVVIAITAIGIGLVELYKHFKPFRDLVNGIGKVFKKVFGGIIDFFKNNWKEIGLLIINPFAGISVMLYKNVKPFRDFVNTVFDVIKSGFDAIGNFFNGFWNGIKNLFNISLGFIAKIWSAEWNGVFNIGKSIWNSISGFLGGFWNGIKSIFNSSLNWISNIWSSSWNGIFNFGKGIWNGITGTLGDWWSGLKSMFKSAGSSISDIWSSVWNGVAKTFSNIWEGIKKTAHNGVKSIVDVLNSGISGIDDVIGMFGGNKNSLKPIKFANGTGALDRHTYSMLNDGNDSPETGNKELAILPNGKAFMPRERNWTGFLPKGTAILNATETKMLMQMQNIQHFAKGGIVGGIENMFNGAVDTVKNVGGSIWGSIKGFGSDLKKGFDMATSIAGDPGKYIQDLIKSPKLKGDVMENLGKGMFDKSKDSAVDFWNTTWKEVSSILESGGGSGSMGEFLQYAIKNFTGREYVYGGFDCSEMVKEALEHFGIKGVGRTTVAQEHSGKLQSLGGDINKTKPGDLVYFGTSGADAHVGIVSDVNRGLMMNQHPQRGGVSSIAAAAAIDGSPRYYHVKGLSSDDSSGNKKDSKDNSGLTKYVHNMFDNSMFKWIQEKLAPFGEDVDSGGVPGEAPKGDHKNWMKQAGIPESWFNGLNEIIQKESGWNPHAKNPHSDAYGIPQALPGSKMKSAGSDWHDNPITQLKWMKSYIKDRYGDLSHALSFRHSHGWYENGGFIDHEQTATMGEGNKLEAIIPLTKRNRAFEILRSIFGIMKPTNNEKNDMGINAQIKTNSHNSDFYSPSTSSSSNNQELNVGNSDKETVSELKKANELNERMFNALLGIADLSKEQIKAIKGSKTDIDDINKQQGSSFNLKNYQLGGG